MSRDALHSGVIKTFADQTTEELFRTGGARKVPADVARRALRKLEAVHAASQAADLRVPPGVIASMLSRAIAPGNMPLR